jgi:hypothetical protein
MRYYAAILLWIVTGLPAASQAMRPAIVFDRITKDAGTVTQGEIAKQRFTYTDKGSGTLEIISVQPT